MGAVATPVLLWLAIGLGLDDAFVMGGIGEGAAVDGPGAGNPRAYSPGANGGVGYLEYFYPGMVLMMVLFTAIFSTISVIEDRREGFLQAVLVSPASRWSIILGKVIGGAAVAGVQGAVLVALWPIVGPWPGLGAMLGAVVVVFAIAAGMTALGLCFAWRMSSAGAYHGVMSVVLMPMWLLCGAVFPIATAGGLKYVMYANPLTYGYALFSGLLHGDGGALGGVGWPIALPVTAALTLAALGGATRVASRVKADGS